MTLIHQEQKLALQNTVMTYLQNEIMGNVHIAPDDDLLETGLLDSMGMMKLVRFIERKFQFEVPFEDMSIEHFVSVDTICTYIISHT